jgi:hypothetical protein
VASLNSKTPGLFSLLLHASALLVVLAPAVYAHGGVSVEDDVCIMTIGPYRAHFTGYQPEVRASQEFCEDIPVVAKSIIVLDFINQPLREMAVDFRIVRDVNEVGVTATAADLGSAADIERATIFYRAAERYPRGSFDVGLTFEESGRFIGVLTAVDDKTGTRREYVSVFPFSVGVTDWWGRLKWIVVSIVFGAGLYLWSSRSGKTAHAAA